MIELRRFFFQRETAEQVGDALLDRLRRVKVSWPASALREGDRGDREKKNCDSPLGHIGNLLGRISPVSMRRRWFATSWVEVTCPAALQEVGLRERNHSSAMHRSGGGIAECPQR